MFIIICMLILSYLASLLLVSLGNETVSYKATGDVLCMYAGL